jgi:PAS domain S-box-containing protein
MAEVLGLPATRSRDGRRPREARASGRSDQSSACLRTSSRRQGALRHRISGVPGDGSIGWLRELAEFQPGPGGKGHHLIGTIQDITEQKSIETALRDSEARMRAFMDHAPLAMFVKDLEGRFTMLNRHDGVFLGRPAEDAIGRRAADFLSSGDAALVVAHDKAVLARRAGRARLPSSESRSSGAMSQFPVRAGGNVVAIGGVASTSAIRSGWSRRSATKDSWEVVRLQHRHLRSTTLRTPSCGLRSKEKLWLWR